MKRAKSNNLKLLYKMWRQGVGQRHRRFTNQALVSIAPLVPSALVATSFDLVLRGFLSTCAPEEFPDCTDDCAEASPDGCDGTAVEGRAGVTSVKVAFEASPGGSGVVFEEEAGDGAKPFSSEVAGVVVEERTGEAAKLPSGVVTGEMRGVVTKLARALDAS